MKVIGLTGGVGSGKSTVAELMVKHFSVFAISTDEIAKEQMKKGGASYQNVVSEFGSSILSEDEEIDRVKLAKVAFSDGDKLKRLNQLTHPNVLEEVIDVIRKIKEEKTYDAVLVETALLIEAGYASFCDEVWYVYASKEDRRDRLVKNRNYNLEKIEDLFSKQKTEEEFREFSTISIDNSEGITMDNLLNQISYFLYR